MTNMPLDPFEYYSILGYWLHVQSRAFLGFVKVGPTNSNSSCKDSCCGKWKSHFSGGTKQTLPALRETLMVGPIYLESLTFGDMMMMMKEIGRFEDFLSDAKTRIPHLEFHIDISNASMCIGWKRNWCPCINLRKCEFSKFNVKGHIKICKNENFPLAQMWVFHEFQK